MIKLIYSDKDATKIGDVEDLYEYDNYNTDITMTIEDDDITWTKAVLAMIRFLIKCGYRITLGGIKEFVTSLNEYYEDDDDLA